MSIRVAAHTPPPSKYLGENFERMRSQRAGAATVLPKNPSAAGMLVNDCIGGAALAAQLGQPRAVILDLLVAGAELGRAAFRLASGAGTVEVVIDGQRLALPATGPTDEATPPMWLRVLGLALALRRPEITGELCALDVDVLRRSRTKVDEFRFDLVETMQRFLRGADWRAAAERVYERSQPAHTRVAGRAYVDVEVTLVRALAPLEARDAPALEAALAAALEAHKAYWGSKQWIGHAIGRIAVAPLGLAALAHDRGIAIDVDSGYLPPWLVRGELTE